MNGSSSAQQPRNSIKAFLGGFMGWTFDAFDFFIVTYVLARLGVLISTMGYLSHGTQDLYPSFLLQQLHLSGRMAAAIGVLAMLGAIIGGTLGAIFSDRYGRRRALIIAQILAILIIPLWVLSHQIALSATGAFFMQFIVQAARGVIPAHINELVSDNVRALLPGFAYQF